MISPNSIKKCKLQARCKPFIVLPHKYEMKTNFMDDNRSEHSSKHKSSKKHLISKHNIKSDFLYKW